jgi:hypothetical protein
LLRKGLGLQHNRRHKRKQACVSNQAKVQPTRSWQQQTCTSSQVNSHRLQPQGSCSIWQHPLLLFLSSMAATPKKGLLRRNKRQQDMCRASS